MSHSKSSGGEQEQEDNESSVVSSFSEPLNHTISLNDLDGAPPLEEWPSMAIFPKEYYEDLSYIWPEAMDANEYGENNLGWISEEEWLPAAHTDTCDNEIRLYDFDEGLEDEVYDSDSPSMVGAGLDNLGNTCFLNSIMQCFTHTVPLIEGLLFSPHYCDDDFCVICAFRYHMQQSLGSLKLKCRRVLTPMGLVNNLKHFSSTFDTLQQEDAHEFMKCALDKLDLRFSTLKMNDPDFEDSIVNKVFGGSLVSSLRCCNCNRLSNTNESLLDLSLDLENGDTLLSALKSFTMVETVVLNCEGCHKKVSMEKKLMLDQTPSIAALHLKRFKTNRNLVKKIQKHVNFPLELDMQPYTNLKEDEDNNASFKFKYNLYAVVVHNGNSPTSGHYFCFVRTSPDTWHKLDDSKVTKVHEKTVLSQQAYILFYSRQGTPWFSNFAEATIPEVLPGNCASFTGGSSCSVEANDFIENDFFNALTPPRGPSSETPEKAEPKKYLAELEKNKNSHGYLESAPGGNAFVQADSLQTGEDSDVGGTSLNVEARGSFWHSEFDFPKYILEQVPLAQVDIDAGVKAKFRDLVADAGLAALRILLMGNAMELKHGVVEKQYKDAAEDVEKWKHKATSLEVCLWDALTEKRAAEKEHADMKEAKETVEKERDSHKDEVSRLERALDEANSAVEDERLALAVYFDKGFQRATEQVIFFNPEAKVDKLDSFKVILEGKLVDEE